MFSNLTFYSCFTVFLLNLHSAYGQNDKTHVSCEKYLECRRELNEKYWECSSKSRSLSQYTCKTELLLREFYEEIIHREKYLHRCYLKESYFFHQQKDCQLSETLLSTNSCSSESFSNHQLACLKLKECCPQISRCIHKEYFKLLTGKVKERRHNGLKQLYKCTSDLSKVISANISSEDTQMASDVMKLNEVVIATVADLGLWKKKKSSNRIKDEGEKPKTLHGDSKVKLFGTSLLDGNSYVRETNNGTALLMRLKSDSIETKEQTNKEIPRSYRHRSQMITTTSPEPDRSINYNNQNRTYIQNRKWEQLSNTAVQNRPFTIRRPWSSDRKIATKRKIGSTRLIKTIRTSLLPVKTKHELKILQIPNLQTDGSSNIIRPSMNVENEHEEQLLKPVHSKYFNDLERQIINVLSTTERLPPTTTTYSNENEEDFESNLQRESSSLVQFAKNAIPLPMKNSVNSGGSGPNDLENEMEAVVDGGTWTMIPKVSTTFSPTKGSPLENFIEQEKMNAADVSDINTQLPLLLENEKLNRVHIIPKLEMFSNFLQNSLKESRESFWQQQSRHERIFGSRLLVKEELVDSEKLIEILRNPKNTTVCELTKTCRKLYAIEKLSCAATADDFSIPGVPKRLRLSKCITELSPQYEELKKITKSLDNAMDDCLSVRTGNTFGVCSNDVPILPHFNNLLECSNQILFLNLHCEKLSSCCSSSSECHMMINNSEAYKEMRVKKQELFKQSQKCQLKSFRQFSLRRTNAKL